MTASEPNDRPRSARLQWLLLVAATWIAYLPATQCGFIWDDDDYVTQNAALRDLDGLKSIWLDPAATPQYYPLVHTTFWCEYQLWGLRPGGYHVTNIVIHTLNALLLWRLLLRLNLPGAWLAAVVFAVHPVHVESVAWVTERKNVLSGCFYLLSLHLFLRYWDFTRPIDDAAPRPGQTESLSGETKPAGWKWYLASMLAFVAALLSKTVTATLPAAILVLVWWKQGRLGFRSFVILLPMLIIGIVFGMVTVWLEKFQVGASGIDWDLTFVERCLIAGRAIWFYAGKLAWPAPLIFSYPRWDVDVAQRWQLLFPLATIAVMIGLWFARAKVGRGPLAAVCLFAGTLFPALGFFDVYPMRFSYVADHFQYLASIALIALAVSMATIWRQRNFPDGSALLKAAAVGVVLLLMTLTWRQSLIYEGLEVLWRDTLNKNPSSFLAHNNLGALLSRRGDYQEAESHIREAMRLKPDFPDAIVNLAKAREGQGHVDEALRYYRQALEISPNFAPALNGLGAMLGAKGDMQAAEDHFQQAVQADPEYVTARVNLAMIYLNRSEHQKAIAELEAVLLQQPDMKVAQQQLVNAYIANSQFDEAETLLEMMLRETPQDTQLLGTLGVVNANQQDRRTAIEYFLRVLSVTPDEPNALYYLALMHRELGETAKAEQYQQRFEQTQR